MSFEFVTSLVYSNKYPLSFGAQENSRTLKSLFIKESAKMNVLTHTIIACTYKVAHYNKMLNPTQNTISAPEVVSRSFHVTEM